LEGLSPTRTIDLVVCVFVLVRPYRHHRHITGRHPHMDLNQRATVPSGNSQRIHGLNELRTHGAKSALARLRTTCPATRQTSEPPPEYTSGDKVYLDGSDIRLRDCPESWHTASWALTWWTSRRSKCLPSPTAQVHEPPPPRLPSGQTDDCTSDPIHGRRSRPPPDLSSRRGRGVWSWSVINSRMFRDDCNTSFIGRLQLRT